MATRSKQKALDRQAKAIKKPQVEEKFITIE